MFQSIWELYLYGKSLPSQVFRLFGREHYEEQVAQSEMHAGILMDLNSRSLSETCEEPALNVYHTKPGILPESQHYVKYFVKSTFKSHRWNS